MENGNTNEMTYEKRLNMFSKDYLTIEDVQLLLGVSYGRAAEIIREIKRVMKMTSENGVRLDINGKVHVQDYLDYFRLPPERYARRQTVKVENGAEGQS